MEDKNKKLDKQEELALFENQKVIDVGMEKEVHTIPTDCAKLRNLIQISVILD